MWNQENATCFKSKVKGVYQVIVNAGVMANKTYASHLQPEAVMYVFQEAQAMDSHGRLLFLHDLFSFLFLNW